jgi:hypothetical protein
MNTKLSSTNEERPLVVPTLRVPPLSGELLVDGRLTESCYQAAPLVENFTVAGHPAMQPQSTKAWLFWQPERFVFAFDVEDSAIVASPPSANKRDVCGQDRVEVFLWSGRKRDTYYCLEIGARGAVYDYAARFYRQMDDSWSLAGWKYAVFVTERGYSVEGEISRAAMEKMGFALRPGARFRVGLFRADFTPGGPAEPTWICWVDAKGPQADFHVAGSFGKVILGK